MKNKHVKQMMSSVGMYIFPNIVIDWSRPMAVSKLPCGSVSMGCMLLGCSKSDSATSKQDQDELNMFYESQRKNSDVIYKEMDKFIKDMRDNSPKSESNPFLDLIKNK